MRHDRTQTRTTASVMPLQMPEPPPVQKSTLPLKMSGLNTSVESAMGAATAGLGDMLGWEREGREKVAVDDDDALYPLAQDCFLSDRLHLMSARASDSQSRER